MKVRLRDTVEVFAARSGALYFSRGAARAEHVIRDPDERSRVLLELVRDDAREPAELATLLTARGHPASPAEAEAALAQLVELRLAEDEDRTAAAGLAPERRERLDRQLAYFADLHGQDGAYARQRRLADARVTVVGCGGLGSWTAAGLVCSGVGRLRLIDPDVVAPSNLNRQILFRPEDVGRDKVEVAAGWLRSFDPGVTVEARTDVVAGPAGARAAASASDLVVLTADAPPYLLPRWVDEACHDLGVPWISGGQFPPAVRIGPLVVPGATACWACVEATARETHPHYDDLVAARRGRAVVAATTGPASGLVGSLLAHEAVAWLADLHPAATAGASVVLDLMGLVRTRTDHPRRPGCPRCSTTQRP
jgi:bacteriocin biosynthesis cyclodehydratase domain-containing protein